MKALKLFVLLVKRSKSTASAPNRALSSSGAVELPAFATPVVVLTKEFAEMMAEEIEELVR